MRQVRADTTMPCAMYTRAKVLALKMRADTMVPCAVCTRSKASAGITVKPTVCSSVSSVPPNTYRNQKKKTKDDPGFSAESVPHQTVTEESTPGKAQLEKGSSETGNSSPILK
ncbi:hypothetical protein NDU88_008507 [Pleurodeles waltl]|uniref:Uncharacterized protein n=1 Tax=Pleurodeles waltl TaxID=8319 RepID=A0AAV7PRS6_PLEWA|nr:hypothetical protein NDU88_008507 [Pleurodeles waltl]